MNTFNRYVVLGIQFVCMAACLFAACHLQAQTNTTWNPGTSNWNNAANWSGGFVPHNGNGGTNWNVFIDGGNATNSVVSLDINATINQLNISTGDLLNILDNRTLTIVQNGQAGAGTINNNGTLNVSSTGSATRLHFSGGATQINGTGFITLTGPAAQISGTGTLTHGANHTIQGNGNIGTNSLSIINLGTFLAGTGDNLTIDPVNLGGGTGSFFNNNLVRATGGGVVTLTGSGSGEFHGTGTYEAQAGSRIDLVSSAIITNSTFTTLGNGLVRVVSGNNATLNNVTNNGSLERSNNGSLFYSGTLTNSGDIHIASGGNATLLVQNGNASLTGGGTIRMSGTGASISGSGQMTNLNNTISGTGNLGFNAISVLNQGVVQAGTGESLVIDPVNLGFGNPSFINQGTVRAIGGGVVTLSGGGSGEFHGAGNYEAQNGSRIDLVSSAIVRNTSFSTTGNGQIQIVSGHDATWDGVTNTGNFLRTDDGSLTVINSLVNSGDMQVVSAGNVTQITNSGAVSLTGGGTIRLSGANARIGGSGTLTNVDNTISGTGNMGTNTVFFVNQGTVQAGSGESLAIDPANAGSGNAAFTNSGIIRATGGGIVTLTGNGGGEFHGNGTYEAQAVSRIDLATGVILRNTTLSTVGDGEIRGVAGNNATWDGVTNTGNFVRLNNGTLTLISSLINSGDMQLISTGNTSQITNSGAISLTGGGTIRLSGADARIGGSGTLTNVDNTISGTGNMGTNTVFFVNQGTIQAGSGESLAIDPANAGVGNSAFTNNGIVRATGGGIVTLTGNGGGEFHGNGTYEAQASSRIDLETGVILRNTTLSTVGDGEIRGVAGNNATWDGVTNTGNFLRADNGSLTVLNSLVNSGDMQVVSAGNVTQITNSGAVSLTGGGTIRLSGGDARIGGFGTLTNVDNTISGTGNMGTNTVFFVNQGTIQAGSGESLAIDPANAGVGNSAFTNSGIVRATGGGTVTLTGNGAGEFSGIGTFEAVDGTVAFDSSAIVQNIGGGILNSGTWRSVSSGGGSLISVANNATTNIATIGANAAVELRGTGSAFTVKGNSIDSTLTSNAGSLIIGGGRVFNTSAGLTNSGSVSVQNAGTQVNVNGTYLQNSATASTNFVTGGMLSVGGGGTLDFDDGLLTGNGDLVGDADFAAATTIAPGNSTGILNITGDTVFTGTMQFELEADLVEGNAQNLAVVNRGLDPSLIGFDQINIFGTADLDGTMFLTLLSGFTPQVGDTFDLITADTLTLQGTFSIAGSGPYTYGWSVLTLPDPQSGNNPRDVLRGIVLSAVPEPGSLTLLFGIGLIGTSRMRIRNRSAV